MKRLIAPALLALACAMPAAAETRSLTGFDSVNVEDRIETDVAIGQSFRVEVTGRDAERVRTEIRGDTLKIWDGRRPMFGRTPRIDANVHVTLPSIDALAASRGATVRMEGLETQEMSLAAAMGGELRVSGTCTEVNAAASMGGVIHAEDFRCRTADAAASMGGEARLFASESLDAAASMGGVINVAGNPRSGDTTTSMGGEVSRHN